jgi:polyphosphate kinase 2 (PPK2 family)
MNSIPSDPQLDQLLQDKFGLSFQQMQKLIQNKNQEDSLNQYRGALSLWAEYSQDTKQKIIVTLDGRDTA